MTARDTRVGWMAAALMALLMLSFASVQSIVMQAAMAMGGGDMPVCGAPMFGMEIKAGPAAAHGSVHAPAKGHKTACPYCAAAAHAPIAAQAPPLRRSVGFVFAAFRVVSSHGPRGPPPIQPRARGPPESPLTA